MWQNRRLSREFQWTDLVLNFGVAIKCYIEWKQVVIPRPYWWVPGPGSCSPGWSGSCIASVAAAWSEACWRPSLGSVGTAGASTHTYTRKQHIHKNSWQRGDWLARRVQMQPNKAMTFVSQVMIIRPTWLPRCIRRSHPLTCLRCPEVSNHLVTSQLWYNPSLRISPAAL